MSHISTAASGTRRKRGVLGGTLSVVGELAITVGILLLLLVAYLLWWTNLEAAQAQEELRETTLAQWENPDAAQNPKAKRVPGDVVAMMYLPTLGDNVWRQPILEGTDPEEINRTIGHYEETAMPGHAGNFAVAGHRVTYGQPFHNTDLLNDGDPIVVETQKYYYLYTVINQIKVYPNETWVVAPDPFVDRPDLLPAGAGLSEGKVTKADKKLGVTEPGPAFMTMTTCEPKHSAQQRLITWSELAGVYPKKDGIPPELVALGIGEKENPSG